MSNRLWLKQLASETKTWMSAVGPLGLEGKHHLETQHTVYVFQDAVCIDIARRHADREDSSPDMSMVGMRVVGWLLVVENQRRLVGQWLPGARAVLWHAQSGKTKIALTSPAVEFVRCSQPDQSQPCLAVQPDDDDETTGEYRPMPPVVPHAADSGSLVRLFP